MVYSLSLFFESAKDSFPIWRLQLDLTGIGP